MVKAILRQSVKDIDDLDEITSACRKGLKVVLNNPSLSFHTDALARGKQKYLLTGSGASQATIGNRNYPVLLLDTINGEIFWLAIVLIFGFANRIQFLDSVSIVVVKGLAFDSKIPILRAEWDCSDDYLNAPHGQPHWHVYPSAILNSNLETEDVLEIATDPAVNIEDYPSTRSLPYFHFAMATRWHEGDTRVHGNLEYVDSLTGWISGCVQYTREQLMYAWTPK